MGKTTVKTKKNTYTNDGKVYEDEIVTTVVETDEGTKTSIQTTTRGPLGDADNFDFSKVKESLSKDQKNRSRSSSSSSDSDDGKKSKSKSEGGGAKGLLGKFKSKSKSKKDNSSDSDDEKKKHHKDGGYKGLLGKFKSKSKKDDSSDSDDEKKKKHSSGGDAKGLLGKLKSKSKNADSCDSDDSSDDEDFAEAAHKEMNVVRKKHCVDKLKLSKEMCKYAKEWAVQMAKDDQMSHRPDGKYGENIFCVSANDKKFKVEARTVIDKWHSESTEHTFGKEPEGTTLKTGHFTQMVWKDTKQVGVAKARSASGLKVFVVANFDPKGNWMGQFTKQVPPAGGFPKRRDSSSSSSSDSSSDEEDFVEDCIKSHNDYRKNHGVQPLKKSKKLNKHAKEWAKTIAKKDNMEQRPKNEYGENIYCVWSSNPKHKIKGNEAVDSWYSEVKDFDFGKEPTDLKHGHFTQIVWEDSKEIGVGTARSKSGKIYVVANYSPAGNYVGSFASKVHNVK